MITLRQEIIKAILEVIEDEALIRKVREIGAKTPQRISYVLVQKNRS
jgi:4-aminobutyrate aminotransferase-like enzyme